MHNDVLTIKAGARSRLLSGLFLLLVVLPMKLLAQTDSLVLPEPSTIELPTLVQELIMNNPEIQAASAQMDVLEARIPQAGTLPDPELRFMQEGMPDFRWNEAMFSRIELMQMVPFPGKLSTQAEIARIRSTHSHHDHLEKINEVLAKLKMAYYDLWLVQQNMTLDRENARLMNQFGALARTRYGAGTATQQEVLKAQIEVGMINNDLITLRQREISAKAMMMSLLNRAPKDTIGYAVIPEEVNFAYNIDSLLNIAVHERPMIVHDSAMIEEGSAMLRMAKQEYLPDFRFGLERMISPMDEFRGWSVTAAITLPFMPWTIGRSSARVDEANASIAGAQASYQANRAMVTNNVRDLYYRADAAKRQLDNFRVSILPQTRQSVDAGLTAYQNGRADFLTLMDAYRTNVNLTKEYFMVRMQFDQSIADLEREVGVMNISVTGE